MKLDNDNMITAPFESKTLEGEREEKDVRLTVRLNPSEQKMLEEVKSALHQPKDSTAVKTMFYLAYYNVIRDDQTQYLMRTLFKNKRNNYRTGVVLE